MFQCPEMMVSDYMDRISQQVRKQEMIEETLEEYKKDAFQRISKIVDLFYVEAIALTIASGYENEDESAIDIVNRLSLNDKHIAGILNDSHMMHRILTDEAQENEHYENQGE